MKKASFYKKLDGKKVKCILCPHNCILKEGQIGFCGARQNIGGELFSLNYGYISSIAYDPIKKKPLFHFYPGSTILSIGSFGCSFKCKFCQNWTISQEKPNVFQIDTDRLIKLAKNDPNCIGIAFTYNEPINWYEYVIDVAYEFKKEGMKTVLVTNGYLNQEPLIELLNYIDAMNVDLKSFNSDFYKNICNGDVDSVKKFIEISNTKVHIEITTLIIPGLNDSDEEMDMIGRWIASLDDRIPLHINRYFPRYKMDIEPTPIETLKRLAQIAKQHLLYVYIGNI